MEIIKEPMEKNDITNLKVTLVGDTSMGKTTFFSRISSNNYLKFLKEKEGIQISNAANYENVYIKTEDRIFCLDIWDTAGLRKYSSLID